MRHRIALVVCFLLGSAQVHACMFAGQEGTVFFEPLPKPPPEADLVAEVAVADVKAADRLGGAMAMVTVTQVIRTSDPRVRQGDILAMKYESSSCGPFYRNGDQGTIFARTGLDSEGRVVLYPYVRKGSDNDGVRPPSERMARTLVTRLPAQTADELEKLNSGCAAFYDISKEKVPTSWRPAYAGRFDIHRAYAKRLRELARSAEDRYDTDLSREKSAFEKAVSEKTLHQRIQEQEVNCPSVEFYTALLLSRWSRGITQELKPTDLVPPVRPAPVCRFADLRLPSDFAVYAAGGYSGRQIDFQIDQSGHQGTQMDVTVNSPDKPVVLMLGAYEPTIWNIRWTPSTTIVVVLASGYHRQAVAGLDKKTPLLISSYDNQGVCGYFYIGSDKLDALNPQARSLFGRPVDLVYLAQENGSVLVGSALPAGTRLVTATENPPQAYHDKSAPLAGPAGLADAVKKGVLRKATPSDGKAWVEAATRAAPKRDVPPVANARERQSRGTFFFDDAYVVLKPFTFPAGLYGGNSAVFLVPKGVPKPAGNPGHSTVYDFNALECAGASCGPP